MQKLSVLFLSSWLKDINRSNLKISLWKTVLSFQLKEKESSFSCYNSWRYQLKPGKSGPTKWMGAVNQFSATKCDLQNWFEVVLAGYHLCWGVKLKLSSIHTKPQQLGGLCMCWFITTAAFPWHKDILWGPLFFSSLIRIPRTHWVTREEHVTKREDKRGQKTD